MTRAYRYDENDQEEPVEIDLQKVLRAHSLWLRGADGGEPADLSSVYFEATWLSDTNFQKANLRGANLRGAFLRGADFREADLSGALLMAANLSIADLRGANLSGAYMPRVDLTRAKVDGAILAEGVRALARPERCAVRSNGEDFVLWPTDCGWRVRFRSRMCAMDDVLAYSMDYLEYTEDKTALETETRDILALFERHMARRKEVAPC